MTADEIAKLLNIPKQHVLNIAKKLRLKGHVSNDGFKYRESGEFWLTKFTLTDESKWEHLEPYQKIKGEKTMTQEAVIRAFQLLFEAGNKVKNFLGFGGASNASNASLASPGIQNAPFVPMAPSGGYSGQAVSFNNNITVNGAIDSESTARQIVEVLNQSSYRGTLGAGAFA